MKYRPTSYKFFKDKSLKDRETKRLYDALEGEFSLIRLIIEARIKHGLSQAELAKKIGTKQSAIARLESGRYNPSLAFLEKVAKGLGKELVVSFK